MTGGSLPLRRWHGFGRAGIGRDKLLFYICVVLLSTSWMKTERTLTSVLLLELLSWIFQQLYYILFTPYTGKNYHILELQGLKSLCTKSRIEKFSAKGWPKQRKFQYRRLEMWSQETVLIWIIPPTFGWSFSCHDMFVLVSQYVLWSLGSPCFFL